MQMTKQFENKLDELRNKSIYERIQYAFDVLWYNSSIPDMEAPYLRKACDLIAPKTDDDDITLRAKGLLIKNLASDIFWSDSDYDIQSRLEIDACVRPRQNKIIY